MPLDAPVRVRLLVVPAFGIDAVDAVNLKLAVLQAIGQGGDHLVIFVLEEAAHGSGEDKNLRTIVAEDKHVHVALQVL